MAIWGSVTLGLDKIAFSIVKPYNNNNFGFSCLIMFYILAFFNIIKFQLGLHWHDG